MKKDYRFSIAHAAYVLGDRTVRKIGQVWTNINPDVQRSRFTAEQDELLLRYGTEEKSFSWPALATTHFPDRSSTQCRRRYSQLIKPRTRKAQTVTKRKVDFH